jgi:hypothetical protein
MWFLLLLPVTWLLSEIFKIDRPIRIAAGIGSFIAIAWLTHDTSTELACSRERIHHMTQRTAMRSIEEVLGAGDTNRLLAAPAAYQNTASTKGTIEAAAELSARLKMNQSEKASSP